MTIGSFDGVHRGHAALLQRARELAGEDGRIHALSFFPHPGSVLSEAPPLLTAWEARARLLREAGADEVSPLEPTRDLLSLDPEAFVRLRLLPLGATDVVEGDEFRFGVRRSGDVGVLRALGEGLGFRVHVVEPVLAGLDDRRDVPVSSTLTRWAIRQGRVRDAASLLGRAYVVSGTVVQGDRLGRTIGFPTANIEAATMLPGAGVYAGWASLPDGRRLPAAINIGDRPTVHGKETRCEAHLLGLPEPAPDSPAIDGLDEYGWPIAIEFRSRLRDQVRFSSVDELQGQLSRDTHRARTLLIHAEAPES